MSALTFWKSHNKESTTTVIEEPQVVEIEVPRATVLTKPTMSDAERSEYVKVAGRIGIKNNAALLNERLRAFLWDENIHIFKAVDVNHFLNQKFGKEKWHWRGLRRKDSDHLGNTWKDAYGVKFSDEVYSEPVPLPVLLTVEKIANEFPEVRFYVSTPGDPNADPFLMVTNRDIGPYIVERWDEPNFRER